MTKLMHYDTKEAATILGLSPRTLENMRNKRIGPDFIKLGSRVLYSEQALAAYVAKNTISIAPNPGR